MAQSKPLYFPAKLTPRAAAVIAEDFLRPRSRCLAVSRSPFVCLSAEVAKSGDKVAPGSVVEEMSGRPTIILQSKGEKEEGEEEGRCMHVYQLLLISI